MFSLSNHKIGKKNGAETKSSKFQNLNCDFVIRTRAFRFVIHLRENLGTGVSRVLRGLARCGGEGMFSQITDQEMRVKL